MLINLETRNDYERVMAVSQSRLIRDLFGDFGGIYHISNYHEKPTEIPKKNSAASEPSDDIKGTPSVKARGFFISLNYICK